MEILKVNNLNFSYENSTKEILKDINFEVKEGEFILICGKSGCGKSTLLKQLKPQLTPHGNQRGNIYFENENIKDIEEEKTSTQIGYVFQNPDAQLVTDKVYHEIAFGLENMGIDNNTIRLKVSEISSFFGMSSWFLKNVDELSGGQKQLLNLASIMIMQPKILILDEPTSQLDPIASREFIDILIRINKEFSTTIIITEHDLEEIYSNCDKVLLMNDGVISYFDTPKNVCENLINDKDNTMYESLPISCKVYNKIKEYTTDKNCPLTIRDGRQFIKNNIKDMKVFDINKLNNNSPKNEIIENDNVIKKMINFFKEDEKDLRNVIIELKNIYFKYNKNSDIILNDLSLKIYEGEIYSILGSNGSGKSTTLSIISKNNKALRGSVYINNKDIKKINNKDLYKNNLALLPQNPQSLFVFETLKEDLYESLKNENINDCEKEKKINDICEILNIKTLLNSHPYDLSGGELQRASLAKILLLNPKILLLDEPTKGLDNYAKQQIKDILLKLKNKNITIIMVSHDIEFSASVSDRCGLFFNGNIVSEDKPRKFFNRNNFYTTNANKMSRNIFENVLTCEDVIKLCQINLKS